MSKLYTFLLFHFYSINTINFPNNVKYIKNKMIFPLNKFLSSLKRQPYSRYIFSMIEYFVIFFNIMHKIHDIVYTDHSILFTDTETSTTNPYKNTFYYYHIYGHLNGYIFSLNNFALTIQSIWGYCCILV